MDRRLFRILNDTPRVKRVAEATRLRAVRRWSLRVTSEAPGPSTAPESHLLFQLLLPQVERRHFARKIDLSDDDRQRRAAPAADEPALFTPNTLARSRYLGNRSPRALLPSRLSHGGLAKVLAGCRSIGQFDVRQFGQSSDHGFRAPTSGFESQKKDRKSKSKKIKAKT